MAFAFFPLSVSSTASASASRRPRTELTLASRQPDEAGILSAPQDGGRGGARGSARQPSLLALLHLHVLAAVGVLNGGRDCGREQEGMDGWLLAH